jgi:hypothetical protein
MWERYPLSTSFHPANQFQKPNPSNPHENNPSFNRPAAPGFQTGTPPG